MTTTQLAALKALHKLKPIVNNTTYLSECCGALPLGYYPETDFCSDCRDHASFYKEGEESNDNN